MESGRSAQPKLRCCLHFYDPCVMVGESKRMTRQLDHTIGKEHWRNQRSGLSPTLKRARVSPSYGIRDNSVRGSCKPHNLGETGVGVGMALRRKAPNLQMQQVPPSEPLA